MDGAGLGGGSKPGRAAAALGLQSIGELRRACPTEAAAEAALGLSDAAAASLLRMLRGEGSALVAERGPPKSAQVQMSLTPVARRVVVARSQSGGGAGQSGGNGGYGRSSGGRSEMRQVLPTSLAATDRRRVRGFLTTLVSEQRPFPRPPLVAVWTWRVRRAVSSVLASQ